MKKLLVILFILPLLSMGQDFKPWSLELGIGGHWEDGSCNLDLEDNLLGLKGRVGYNLSKTLGLYGSGEIHGLTFKDFGEVTYLRAALGTSIDLLNITDFGSDSFQVFLNLDMGGARVEHNGMHDNILTTAAGIMPVVRLNDDLSLKLEATSIMHYNGSYDFQQRTGLLNTIQVGVVLNLGKKESPDMEAHYATLNPHQSLLAPGPGVLMRNRENVVVAPMLDPCAGCVQLEHLEHVFFHFDVDTVDKDGLDAIMHILDKWEDGDTVEVTGHACPSNNPAYNMDLSYRRADHVVNRLIKLGIPKGSILLGYKGEDHGKHDHDMARRVDILLKKQQ